MEALVSLKEEETWNKVTPQKIVKTKRPHPHSPFSERPHRHHCKTDHATSISNPGSSGLASAATEKLALGGFVLVLEALSRSVFSAGLLLRLYSLPAEGTSYRLGGLLPRPSHARTLSDQGLLRRVAFPVCPLQTPAT